MALRHVVCPVEDREPLEAGPILGCGFKFVGEPDFEGFVDCPNCGMWFNPDHPNSQPQPVP